MMMTLASAQYPTFEMFYNHHLIGSDNKIVYHLSVEECK